MSLGKKDIVKNISSKAHISLELGNAILNKFIEIISVEAIKHSVKISNFGSFHNHSAPKRIGRNPLTKEEFVIQKRQKITFSSSKATKDLLN